MIKNEQCSSSILDTVPMVMQAIRMEMRRSAQTDLTVPQFRILARLHRAPTYPCELAEHIGVSVPAISRIVSLLQEKELVKKVQDKTDRRLFRLNLTAKGRRIFTKGRGVAAEAIQKKLNNLDEEKRIALIKGLSVLKHIFADSEESNEAHTFARPALGSLNELRARAIHER